MRKYKGKLGKIVLVKYILKMHLNKSQENFKVEMTFFAKNGWKIHLGRRKKKGESKSFY